MTKDIIKAFLGRQNRINPSQLKCAFNLNLICTKKVLIGHKIWGFFDSLVLMLLLNSTKTAPLEGSIPALILNYDYKFALNIKQICPK